MPRKNRSKKTKKSADGEAAPPVAPTYSEAAAPVNTDGVDSKGKAREFKKKGNAAFAKKDFAAAVAAFTEAISWDPKNHVLWSNRSAALTMSSQFPQAIRDANKCIELRPHWPKGHLRLGTAALRADDLDVAQTAFDKVLELESKNTLAAKGLVQVAEKRAAAPAPKEEADEKKGDGSIAVGIDLGTTNSCVAVFRNGQVEIIPNDEGKRTTPSVISFMPNGNRLVGEGAQAQAASNPENTLYETKRLIGRLFSDSTVQTDAKKLPFKIIEGKDDMPMIEVTLQPEGEEAKVESFAPEQISALVLAKMKSTAEKYLGVPVTRAVITVPAYFNDAQRNATKSAGAIAGLDVLRIINEPTAAALAYGLDQLESGEAAKTKGAKYVLVFDLGGGTFDVSLLSIEDGIFEVKATGGDTHLGGEDFDDLLAAHVGNEIRRKHKMIADGLLKNPRVIRQIRRAAEEVKRTLSAAATATVELEDLVALGEDAEPIDFTCVVTRAKFERLCMEPFKRCIDTVKRVLKDARMTVEEVHDVVLVGGSTRIPRVQELLQKHFKGRELCRSVNPDEAVAYGAAVQAAIMTGVRDGMTSQLLLVDVTPLSLGIETTGRVMSTVIMRNTPIPCEMTKTYTTDHNYQESVTIPIFEGERACTDGNNSLGEFTITGIQRAKRGEPKIAVTFNLDADGILKVRAVDEVTGAENRIEIANKGRLSTDEIDRMVADAEKFKKEDAARLKLMECIHELEEGLYRSEDALSMFKSGSQALTASATRMKAMAELQLVMDTARMWVESKRSVALSSGALAKTQQLQQKLDSSLFAFTMGMH